MEEQNFNPETCTIEELKEKIESLKNEEEYYNTMQLSAKTFINSVYGVFGTAWFNLANTDIAESITLQGQDLIKFSVIEINKYINDFWNQDYDGHKRIADRLRRVFGDAFNYNGFLDAAKNNTIKLDTVQVYGDSVVGSSMVSLSDGKTVEIQQLFNDGYDPECDLFGKIRVKSDNKVLCVNTKDGTLSEKPIKYIMMHRLNKKMFRVYNDKISIICTEDHSLLKCNNGIEPVKPTELCNDDVLCVIDENLSLKYVDCFKIEYIDSSEYEYVYDIEVDDSSDEYHNFFANGVLVHNTDSVSSDSIIRTKKHTDGITIEDLYNENEENSTICETTLAGHESVCTDDKVLNFDGDSLCSGRSTLYYGNVKRLIRHKVSKPKWRISTQFGNSVEVTEDHSMMVLRGEKLYKVKPCEISTDDKALVLEVDNGKFIERPSDIIECVKTGDYDDEYVYDIEMDDDNHTFFANDILVHNSAYITLQPIIDACGVPSDQQLEFDLAFYEEILSDYMDDKFDEYAKRYHCKNNYEKFELEKISRTIIMLAKKNYMCDVEWIDTGTRFDPLEHVTYTGFDVVKGTTTDYCREEMKTFVNYVMGILNTGRKPTLSEIVTKLKEIKKRFIMQNPNDISITKGISNYENFVKNDKSKDIEYYKFKTKVDDSGNEYVTNDKLPVPIHVRAAAVYNNMLFNKGKRYKSKYSLLKSGEKVRFYYTGEDTVFGFVPDSFPIEFAPAIDIDIQFEKMLLSPLNRIVSAMGYFEIPPTLTYTPSLF